MTAKAALWVRVSTNRQETANQMPDLQRLAEQRGYKIVRTFEVEESAWKGNHRAARDEVIRAAHRGEFSVLVIWALDRICREGPEDALKLVRELDERGCAVVSHQEDWMTGSPDVQKLMLSIFGWLAEQESKKRSERVKAGLERRKREGKPVGRPKGTKDKGTRNRSGYVAAWEAGGARREAEVKPQ